MTTERHDKDMIKAAAANRWAEILVAIGGLSESLLDRNNHPCPKCGGKDRFRFLNNETGGLICNKCFPKGGGDGIAVLQWLQGWDFPSTLKALAGYLGIAAVDDDEDGCPLEVMAKAKRVPAESLVVYGTKFSVIFPAYGPDGAKCTQFSVSPRAKVARFRKGTFAKGKPASLFFPHDVDGVRLPKPKETWAMVEGPKDAAALYSLGYKAVGLNTCRLAQKFVKLFNGVNTIFVPDRDSAGIEGSEASARRLYGKAESIAVAHLPAEIKDKDGDDVRDILARADGESLVRQAIAEAVPWEPPASGLGGAEVLVGLDESRVASEVLEHLGNRGLYQRGGCLVHVTKEQAAPSARINTPSNMLRIRNLPASILRETITSAVHLVEPGEQEDKHVRPAKWLIEALHQRGEYPSDVIPPLVGVVRCPTIRADGSVLQDAGYDSQSGLLYQPDGKYPAIPNAPTSSDVEQAVNELLEVICDFPFVADSHRPVWLALLLTLVGRSAIAGPCPMFVVDANTAGSGKGLLCDSAGMIAFGDELPKKSWPREDDEVRKTITSVAREAIPAVMLDNLASTLGSASLDAALTATSWTDRILGKSETTGTLPLNAVWVATGNNIVLGADTARRSLYCRLESPEENPEDRQDFRHSRLLSWVRSRRHKLAAAAVTILRGYFAAGKPDQQLKPWGSYEAWSDLIRGALVWSGQSDPAETRTVVRDSDRTAELLRLLLDGIEEADNGDGVLSGELAKLVQQKPDEYPCLTAAITELCGSKVDGRHIGYRIRAYAGRVCGGRRLVQRRTKAGRRWGVDGVNGADLSPHSYAGTRAHAHTRAHARGAETSTPLASSAPTGCNHQNPDSWLHRDGKAHCPGCDRYMGRVPSLP